MFWKIVGTSAALLTMFGFLPQIIKILRVKSVKDVSILTLLQFSLGICLWIAYGIHLKNPIIITANVVSLSTLIILLFLYSRYRKEER